MSASSFSQKLVGTGAHGAAPGSRARAMLFRIDSRDTSAKNPDAVISRSGSSNAQGRGKEHHRFAADEASEQAERLVLDLRRSNSSDEESILYIRRSMQGDVILPC